MRTVMLIAIAALMAPTVAGEGLPAIPVTAESLANIERIPFGKEGAAGSPEFHAIVRQGLPIVQVLAELLDDSTLTDNRVPLWGGYYAVGDVAMSAISGIIRGVPWLEFVADSDDPRIAAMGFGVYWELVRDSPENRWVIKSKFLSWFREHERHLVWQSIPESVDGGIYELRDAGDAAGG